MRLSTSWQAAASPKYLGERSARATPDWLIWGVALRLLLPQGGVSVLGPNNVLHLDATLANQELISASRGAGSSSWFTSPPVYEEFARSL